MKQAILFWINAESAAGDKATLRVGVVGGKQLIATVSYGEVCAMRDYINKVCDSWKAAKAKIEGN